jgi:hypothetical protein
MSPNQATPFKNRKGTLSQNVIVVCDFDLKITMSQLDGKDQQQIQWLLDLQWAIL